MTNSQNLGTIEATNPVLAVAPFKEETEMLRATEKSPHYTADFRRRTLTRAIAIPSPIRKISCSATPKNTAFLTRPFS